MKEGNLRTVAIPCLTPKFALMQRMELKKTRHAADAEPDTTASLGGEYCVMHTLLRSVRRWLEKMQSDIDAVVLVPLSPSDAVIYRQYMKAYFPRNKVEEVGFYACALCCKSCGVAVDGIRQITNNCLHYERPIYPRALLWEPCVLFFRSIPRFCYRGKWVTKAGR